MHPCLSGARTSIDSIGEHIMKKIAILGGKLSSLSMAHTLLDYTDSVEIHIIDEKAEIGLIGEYPGIISKWPLFPKHWISTFFSQEPSKEDNAVRHSWLVKAMATQLSKRNTIFHLRTRVLENTNNQLKLSGAGYIGRTTILFDNIFDNTQDSEDSELWKGGICLSSHAPNYGIQGKRNDGTIEIWWKKDEDKKCNTQWVQRMKWQGENPEYTIQLQYQRGIELARGYIDTIIHP